MSEPVQLGQWVRRNEEHIGSNMLVTPVDAFIATLNGGGHPYQLEIR